MVISGLGGDDSVADGKKLMMIDSCLSPCSSLLSSIYLDNCSELYSMWKSRSYRFESDRSPDIGSCSSNGKSA